MAVINDDNLSHVLNGGIEDDLINGNGGNDTIDGGAGGIDTLNGGTGNDVIYARSDDSASGGDGDDFLIVQADIPATLDGGAGNDTLRFESGYDISTTTLTGIENLYAYGTVYMTAAQLGSFSLVSGYASNYTSATVALTKGATISVNLSATLTGYFQLYGSTQGENVTFNAGHLYAIFAYMGNGNDRVSAGAGNDSLRGEEGRDTLIGLAGNDSLDGGDGRDVLTGGDGEDLIYVRAGDDANGGAGNDFFLAYDPQLGTINGGLNTDIIRFEGSFDISSATLISVEQAYLYGTTSMTAAQMDAFALLSGYNSGYTSATVALTQGGLANVALSSTLTYNFALLGSDDADLITFNPAHLYRIEAFMGGGDDQVATGAGNDSLRGDEGNDSLYGMAGNDSLDGSIGLDSLDGGAGNDYLVARAFDTILGGGGDDFIDVAESLPAVLNGGTGTNDVLRFTTSLDISNTVITGIEVANLYGNDSMTAAQLDGFDLITGYASNYTTATAVLTQGGTAGVTLSSTLTQWFTLYGSNDADLITFDPAYLASVYAYMGRGDDSVIGASGNDSLRGDEGNDSLYGMAGNDSLDGSIGLDSLDGGAGNDYLVARAFDTILGGGGDDFIDVAESLPAVLNGGTGTNDVLRFTTSLDISNTVITGIEVANLNGNDSMTAAQLDGFDLITGYASNYTTATAVLTQGGTAGVTLSSTLTQWFTLYGSNDADLITFDPAYLASVYAYMGRGDDSVIGASGNDSLRGDEGNDSLYGMAGNDSLDGSSGEDLLDGGAGNDYLVARVFDTILGGANDDFIDVAESLPAVLNGGSGTDTLRFLSGYDITGTSLTGIEVLAAYGAVQMTAVQLESFASIMGYSAGYTSASVNLTEGGTVSAILSSTLTAGFTLTGSTAADIVSFNIPYIGALSVYAGFGNDKITGATGNDYLRGQGGNDSLSGLDGNDTFEGGNGADTINGGAGIDVMYGGSGRDIFTFATNNASTPGTPDRIMDFESAGVGLGDTINLSAIDADGGAGANDAFIFGSAGIGGLSLIDSGTDTLVQLNTDNDAAFEIVILIQDGAVLASAYTAADFNL